MGSSRVLAVGFLALFSLSTITNAQIYVSETTTAPVVTKRVRVSVKIMNDAEGHRPTDGFYNTDDQILSVFDDCNAALAAMKADWRLELVEIKDVKGASEWFGPFDCDLKGDFEAYVRAAPSRFYFRNNAINVYVISELVGCGGYCSIPSSGEESIIINNRVGILNWSLGWLHEIGHYFGLEHTYQCLNRPCQSNHDICTGAGSERRNCPDACPDTNNIMGAHDDLVVGKAEFSPCQLGELAFAMRDGGVRAKVVEYVSPADGPVDSCGDSTPPATGTGASAATDTPADADGAIPRAPVEPVTVGTTPASGGNAAPCKGAVDATPPEVLRIDPQYASDTQRVNGVIVRFSEAIETSQVQNGVDIAVTLETLPMEGSIRWQDGDKTLVWSAARTMPSGQYGIFLTSADATDFQDLAGNVLESNTDGYFAIGFSLDEGGRLVLPSSSACGAGGLLGGLMTAPFIALRRRHRRRG